MRRPGKGTLKEADTLIKSEFETFLHGSTAYFANPKKVEGLELKKQLHLKTGDDLAALVEISIHNFTHDAIYPNDGVRWFLTGDVLNLAETLPAGNNWKWFNVLITNHRTHPSFLFSGQWMFCVCATNPELVGFSQTSRAWSVWEKDMAYSMCDTDGERHFTEDNALNKMIFSQIPIMQEVGHK